MKKWFQGILFSMVLVFSVFAVAAEKIDINSANKKTLMTIKGIGEVRAEAIINYRKKHGAFKKVDDLTKIKGIGEDFIKKNRKHLKAKSKKKKAEKKAEKKAQKE